MKFVAVADLLAARAAKRHLQEDLRRRFAAGAVGIKPVDGGYAVLVNLPHEADAVHLPVEIDGVDVVVEVTGIGFPQS